MSDAYYTPPDATSPPAHDQAPAALRHAWRGAVAAQWDFVEQRLFRWSDRLNPILVKETRQAIKSWSFTLTFVLLLVAVWVVTIGGVALIGPSIFYAAGGGEMLMAYYTVLAFPLIVIVPFSAFRSLAAEREDNTYDLLSITSLWPRQIISGKLGSAVVQMGVYFSAITPCLAFSYLLRGVDLPTIAMLIVYTFFGSLGLSMIGLLLATLSQQRQNQIILSVAFVALLLGAFQYTIGGGITLIRESAQLLLYTEFWMVNLALATFYLTTFVLAYLAAAAMITFATENRSTPLRIAMLLQQACWIGWLTAIWTNDQFRLEAIRWMAASAAAYWFVMGTMLTSESRDMSHRVMRRLPQSFVGRALLTWFNPGPGTGYMFAVANLTLILLLSLAAVFASRHRAGWEELTYVLVIGWSYAVAYLGVGRIVIAQLRRITLVTMFAGVLIHTLLVLAGSGIPTTVQLMSNDLRNVAYSYLQVTNPIWSLNYIWQSGVTPEAKVLLMVVPAAAACVWMLNLPSLIRELQKVRTSLPDRVAQDEAERHPAPAPAPTSPWDTGEAT